MSNKSKKKKTVAPRPTLVDLGSPFDRFLQQQVSGGMLLFGAALLALIWANSPWGHTYEALWHLPVGLEAGKVHLTQPLHLWINDGLMAIFFFVIGLEIKREIITGELSEPGKAVLPVMAAVGGMIAPVLFFLLFNPEVGADKGWGIPMATDIAFSLGILQLLGKRVPIGLKVFLTAFAIVDDLGAVAVIAIFYSHGLQMTLLLWALGLLVLLGILSWRGLYNKYLYLLIGLSVWALFFKGGLHPTLAGVLIALTIPIRRFINLQSFLDQTKDAVRRMEEHLQPSGRNIIMSKKQLDALDDIENATSDVVSPLQHMEHRLHGYVGYIIMPLFALANAGVPLNSGTGDHTGLILSLAGAMLIGKFVGIVAFSWGSVKLGLARLPEGMTNRHLLGAGLLGGLGFTMALFIAALAYPDIPTLNAAKLGILIGSIVAGAGGYLFLRSAPMIPEKPPSAPVPEKPKPGSGGLAIGKTVLPRNPA